MKKRNLLGLGALNLTTWSTPFISSLILPNHAQATTITTTETPVTCSPNIVNGIELTVTDDQGNNISSNATATLTSGSYSEILKPQGNVLVGAQERAGTYNLEAEAEGFIDNSVSDIEVTLDDSECHVETVKLTVSLEKDATTSIDEE